LLVVEHGGLLAHQVIREHRLAAEADGVLGDRVEPEERLSTVEDVELEHRRRAVHAHLRACGLDQSEVGQLGDGLGDGVGVAVTDLLGALPEGGLIA
jgi:hypothetical protein